MGSTSLSSSAEALNQQVLNNIPFGEGMPNNMVSGALAKPGDQVIPSHGGGGPLIPGEGGVIATELPRPAHTRNALKIHQPKPGSLGAPSIATDDKKTVGPGPLMGSGRRLSPGGMI